MKILLETPLSLVEAKNTIKRQLFQALQALKCGYAKHTGITEYFTVQDISAAFDISESEAERLMKESPDCLQVTFPEWMQMQ